jgi:hypothetical protein
MSIWPSPRRNRPGEETGSCRAAVPLAQSLALGEAASLSAALNATSARAR